MSRVPRIFDSSVQKELEAEGSNRQILVKQNRIIVWSKMSSFGF